MKKTHHNVEDIALALFEISKREMAVTITMEFCRKVGKKIVRVGEE